MLRFCKFLLTALFAFIMVMDGAIADVQSAKTLLDSIQINENTDPEIQELYQELTNALAEVNKNESSSVDALKENAQKMRDKEQSIENKLLGAAGIATVGIGGMQTLSALAEQNADDDADQDMRAYLATFRCDYGQGRNITGGETNIQLPGGNELLQFVTEYKQLAASLKSDKEALGIMPGIESEIISDSAVTGLYDDVSIGTQKGAFTSLSRALLDENSDDATELSEMYKDTLEKRQTGTALALGGVGIGIAGNIAINGVKTQNNEFDGEYEESKYEKMSPMERVDAIESDLIKLIHENEQLMNEYNENLRLHQEYIATITNTSCREYLSGYISRIEELAPVSDKLQQIPVIGYDLADAKEKHASCVAGRFRIFEESITKGPSNGQGIPNACDSRNKNKSNMKCITGVFNWINVNMIQAVRIAKEYARVRDGKTITYCSDRWVESYNDDYVLCKTADGVYYSFQFDDLTETGSDRIRDNSAKAICEGVYKGHYNGASLISGEGLPKNSTCRFDSRANCNELYKALKHFDFMVYTTTNANQCNIYFTPYTAHIKSKNKTGPVYGRQKYVEKNKYANIDNFEFRKAGLQVRGDMGVVDVIRHWLSFKTGKSLADIRCNDGTTVYYGNDAIGGMDDILACYISGKRVDLVFDDFSENFSSYTKQFLQAGFCMNNGGLYSGNSCIGAASGAMTKEQCDSFTQQLKNMCPECDLPKWENGVCKTQENAAFVSFIDTYGPALGVAVVSVALAVPSGGSSLAMAGLGAVSTGVSIGTDYYIASQVTDFIDDVSSKCTAARCTVNGSETTVENILQQYMTRMLSLKGEISSTQVNALDAELARLLKLLPKNSPTYNQLHDKFQQGGTSWGTGEQIIKNVANIVGVGLSVISLGSNVYKNFNFARTLKALKDMVASAADGYTIGTGVSAIPI